MEITDDPRHQPHQPGNTLTGGSAKSHGMNAASLYVDTKQPRTSAPVSALGSDSRHIFKSGTLKVRRFTPAECMRLMSAPDDFQWPEKITKTAMYRIAGNGQASLMVHHLAQAMRRVDPDSQTVISLFCGGGLGDCGFHGRYWTYATPPEPARPAPDGTSVDPNDLR